MALISIWLVLEGEGGLSLSNRLIISLKVQDTVFYDFIFVFKLCINVLYVWVCIYCNVVQHEHVQAYKLYITTRTYIHTQT